MAFKGLSDTVTEGPVTSYLTIGEVEGLVSFREEFSDFSSMTEAQKEALLNYASGYLDTMYVWSGEKVQETQSLEFPRDFSNGQGLDVPNAVNTAVALLALYFMNEDIGDISQESVGGASISYRFTSSIASREINNLVLRFKSRTLKFNVC